TRPEAVFSGMEWGGVDVIFFRRILRCLSTTSLVVLTMGPSGSHQASPDKPVGAGPASAEHVRVLGTVPLFRFHPQTGAELGSKERDARVWTATFIFPRRAQPGPLQMKEMSRLVQKLADGDRDAIRFVSFAVDPVPDTPQVLAEYGRRY